ncbi:MAG: hypothetical protein P4L69_07245, partial [Desulfosporosinus sp.]|nr:hypothetical protein [Desulfosporosinus sp.]
MISPNEYGDAIGAFRFLAAPIKMGPLGSQRDCQLTVVEIVMDQATDKELTIAFCLPGVAQDMSGLVGAMGQTPINEAMDSWNHKVEQITTQRCYIHPVEFAAADAQLAKLTGMPYAVLVKVPLGPCVVTCAWEHDFVVKDGHRVVMVPTHNESVPSWRMEAILMGCDTSPYGEPALRPLNRSLRWDLAAQANITFPDLDTATLVEQHSGALPFHNLYFPAEKRNASDREYLSVCGALLRDETAQRLVSFYDVGFQPLAAVCGAIVRDGFNFEQAHVPFTVTERM